MGIDAELPSRDQTDSSLREDFTSHMYAYGEIRDRYVNTGDPLASAIILAPKLVMDGALVDIAAIAHLPE